MKYVEDFLEVKLTKKGTEADQKFHDLVTF